MVTVEYSEAAVEVLGVIHCLEEEEQKKIPKFIIRYLEDNQSTTYNPNIDFSDNIENLKLMDKTKQILAGIYMDYLVNEEEREEYNKKLIDNETKYQEELKKSYDVDVFKNKNNNYKVEENMALIEVKENILSRIIKRIKKIFMKKEQN